MDEFWSFFAVFHLLTDRAIDISRALETPNQTFLMGCHRNSKKRLLNTFNEVSFSFAGFELTLRMAVTYHNKIYLVLAALLQGKPICKQM